MFDVNRSCVRSPAFTCMANAFWRVVLDEGDDPGRKRQLIASVLVIAVLLVAGLWLTGALRSGSAIQDCVAAGRTNCAPVAQ